MNRNYVFAAGAVAIGVAGWLTFAPGGDEETAAPGAPFVQVVVPALDGEAAQGEQLFNASCAQCHGANAAGDVNAGPPFIHALYQPNHHGDAAFYTAARNGVRAHHWRFGNMPPIPGVSDGDLAKIIVYIRTMQRANNIF